VSVSREQRLGLVVATALESGDFDCAVWVAHAALGAGVAVGVFLMGEAVMALVARRSALDALADAGCQLTACAQSAAQLGLTGGRQTQVELGSQDDHAALLHKADRVLAFT
jgi:hypothetical protein